MFYLKKEDFVDEVDDLINVGRFSEVSADDEIIFT